MRRAKSLEAALIPAGEAMNPARDAPIATPDRVGCLHADTYALAQLTTQTSMVSAGSLIFALLKAELFSHDGSSHWSRSALCHHDVDIRWASRVHRIVVEVDRPRSVVLLLPSRR